MNLTKGEYAQFSQKGRMNLLIQWGTLIKEKYVNDIEIKIYLLYGFYVEVHYHNEQAIKIEPVLFKNLLSEYY
jgi:hypothetical protein